MSWQTEIPIIVRILINDLGETPTYSTDRLLQTISVAAKYVQFDIDLNNQYNINVETQQITPDPTENRDDVFISLVSLKAACIIDQSNFRTKAASEGIKAGLGPAQLSLSGHLSGFRDILAHGPCKLYSDLTTNWDIKQATAVAAILGPFVGNDFDPRYLFMSDLSARSTRDGFYT